MKKKKVKIKTLHFEHPEWSIMNGGGRGGAQARREVSFKGR